MKSIIKFFIICLCLLYITGCEDMNSVNQAYLDRGETFYTGKISSLQAIPGNGRVKFLWTVNSDPRITRTMIYWNEGVDSATVAVNRTRPDSIELEHVLSLPEGNYVFEFVTKDDKGHRSLGVERTVGIYGVKYIASLQNRNVASITLSKITWLSTVSSTIQYVTVRYTDYTDPDHPEQKALRVENADTETTLSGAKSGEELSVTTSYLPENGLDIVDALPKIYTLP